MNKTKTTTTKMNEVVNNVPVLIFISPLHKFSLHLKVIFLSTKDRRLYFLTINTSSSPQAFDKKQKRIHCITCRRNKSLCFLVSPSFNCRKFRSYYVPKEPKCCVLIKNKAYIIETHSWESCSQLSFFPEPVIN